MACSATRCEDPLMCFSKVGVQRHFDSHICFSKRVPSRLQPLEAAGVIAALEDGITKLQILYQTIPVEKNSQDEEPYGSLKDRFSNEIKDNMKYLDFAGVRPMEVQAMLKLQNDRTFAERVLRKTVEDLRCNNGFLALHGAMELQNAKMVDENEIVERVRTSEENVEALKELFTREKELMMRQDSFWNLKDEELLANSHDARLIAGLTLAFARKWEDTRRHQLNLIKQQRDGHLQYEIDDILDNLVVQEERAHLEITLFLEEEHTLLKKDLDRWTDEYDEQMATRDAEISYLRQKKEANLEALEEGRKEMEIRSQVKEKALELQEKYERKRQAERQVTIIQAWWRGIFYRKNLLDKALKLMKVKKKKGKKGKKK